MGFTFHKAERRRAKLRLGLCGPSGSGKTHSALLIASGLCPGGTIIVIDTEHASAELEVGKPGIPEYGVGQLDPPYTPARYIEAIRAAEAAGADVIIVDSLSHAWFGEGGVLEIADKSGRSAASGGNRFAGWRDATPQHNHLVEALVSSQAHVIVTMRTKTSWEIVEDDKGRKKPVKLGLKPEQREGMEYEFTAVLDLSVDGHIASTSKDRTSLFDGQFNVPTPATGAMLRAWLESGVETPAPTQSVDAPAPAVGPQPAPVDKAAMLRSLFGAAKRCGFVAEDKSVVLAMAHAAVKAVDGPEKSEGWTAEQWAVARAQFESRERWLQWCHETKGFEAPEAIAWAEESGCAWKALWTAENLVFVNSKMTPVPPTTSTGE